MCQDFQREVQDWKEKKVKTLKERAVRLSSSLKAPKTLRKETDQESKYIKTSILVSDFSLDFKNTVWTLKMKSSEHSSILNKQRKQYFIFIFLLLSVKKVT